MVSPIRRPVILGGGSSKKPTLALDFVNKSVDPRISTTRTGGGATYFDSTGILQLASANTARIDYGPIPGGSTNWLLQSGAITTSPWANRNSPTFTSGQLAPDGSSTAFKVAFPSTTPSLYDFYQDIPTLSNQPGQYFTMSVYAKDSGNGWTHLQLWNFAGTGSGLEAYYNLSSGVLGTTATAGTASNVSSTITAVGNGWYRLTLSGILSTAGTMSVEFNIRTSQANSDNGGSAPVIGNGTFYWHPQVETSSTVNTYIATTTSAVNLSSKPLGLLVEETRLNSVVNPRAEGAVIADGVERVTNGNFSLDPINASPSTVQNGWSWSVAGGTSTVTWNGSQAVLTGDGTNACEIDTSITTVVGNSYMVTFDIQNAAANILVGNSIGSGGLINATTSVALGQTFYFTATATTTFIGFAKTSASAVNLDNVSIKSAGKVPTNWSIDTGITRCAWNIIGTGSESGIPYIDVRYFGTAPTGDFLRCNFETSTVLATVGQSFTLSAYIRLLSGSFTNITSGVLTSTENVGGNDTYVSLANGTYLNAALATQRKSGTAVIAGASTASISGIRHQFGCTAGAVDITLRFGLPQLEQGLFVTSPILPAVSSPAATTRNGDQQLMPFTVGNRFTMAVEAMIPVLPPTGATTARLLALDDGTQNNRFTFAILGAGTKLAIFEQLNAGTLAQPQAVNNITPGVVFKGIASTDNTTLNVLTDGSATSSIAGSTPTGISALGIGYSRAVATQVNGYVRAVSYWPRALSTAEMQTATTLSNPTLDLDFTTGTVDSRIVTTRTAGGATYFDNTGVMQLASANTPRIDYGSVPGTYNFIRNSTMQGTVNGTPGTRPNFWTLSTETGLSSSVIGSGTTSTGLPYVDIRVFGTATASAHLMLNLAFDIAGAIPASYGQTWTISCWYQMISDTSQVPIAGIQPYFVTNGTATTYQGGTSIASPGALTKLVSTVTITNTGAANFQPSLWATSTGVSGNTYDFTFRVAAPQAELSGYVGPFVPTSTGAAGNYVTNWIRNNTNINFVAGTPGTMPTNWNGFSSPNQGLQMQTIGSGVEANGASYIDIRIFGTCTANTNWGIIPEPIPTIKASLGQTWTHSMYLKMLVNTTPADANIQVNFRHADVNNALVGTAFAQGVTVSTMPTTWTRYSVTGTLDSTVAYSVFPRMLIFATNGVTYDYTFRFGGHQMEQSPVANNLINTTGAIASTGNVAKGLLVEEARTNSIRNPRCEGITVGIAGSGGVNPTFWSNSALTGVVVTWVGNGYEQGIPYVDVSFVGTPTATAQYVFQLENAITVSANTAYTASAYFRLMSGNLTNVTSLGVQVNYNPGGTFLNLTPNPNTGPLALQRSVGTRTSGASDTSIQPYFVFSYTSGQAISFTIRIGCPQIETGGFATSPILPVISTPAVTTRAKDVVTMPINTTWYGTYGGTYLTRSMFPSLGTSNSMIASMNDNTGFNRISFYRVGAGLGTHSIYGVAGTNTFIGSSANLVIGVPTKAATTWDGYSNNRDYMNGVSIATGTGAAPTNVITQVEFGTEAGGSTMNGYVMAFRYWTRSLTATELLAATT